MTDSILLFSALTELLSHTLTKLHDVKHAYRSFKKSFFMSNFLVIRSILTLSDPDISSHLSIKSNFQWFVQRHYFTISKQLEIHVPTNKGANSYNFRVTNIQNKSLWTRDNDKRSKTKVSLKQCSQYQKLIILQEKNNILSSIHYSDMWRE